MYEINQLEIPDSFMALYVKPGHDRPSASRQHISARYELCEDLANQLFELARAHHFDQGVAEDVVLRRMHDGLQDPSSGLAASEAGWVIRRLAELLAWDCPDLPVLP